MKANLQLSKTGQFTVKNADALSYLYFPLTNFYSLKSSITPALAGGATVDHNHFILPPSSIEDLQNGVMNRNVFLRVNDEYTWSITGHTAHQVYHPDNVTVKGDFLAHTLLRENDDFSVEVESFVPYTNHYQELHKVTITNKTKKNLQIKPFVSFPLYCRSADNYRDHRHVSALFNRATIHQNGLVNNPTMSFNERGHGINETAYGVFVSKEFNTKQYWPILEEFVGEGHSLFDPYVVKSNAKSTHKVGDVVDGYELSSAFESETIELLPNDSTSFVVSLFMSNEQTLDPQLTSTNITEFDALLLATKKAWDEELSPLTFHYEDDDKNGWLRWVTLQPILRRIYGNSFMPHHDYGRGGKGWRDLWQDCLALILMNPTEVRSLLLNNFKGVRIDGSNATIIGDKPGEFLADRNNIPRVWMDHGSWPILTVQLYIDKYGDSDLLLEKQQYFHDGFTHYTKSLNPSIKTQNNVLHDKENKPYEGTILEHMILQNLVPYYNVGKHNNLRLEDADWNDGLDMAHNNGESVAFTGLYGHNLILLADIITTLNKPVELLKEIETLLVPCDSEDMATKEAILLRYFDAVDHTISGSTKAYDPQELADMLRTKGSHLLLQVRNNEWLEGTHGSWFNGYYDDDSKKVDDPDKGNMTLTGQVFAILSGSATDKQIESIIEAADKHLFNKDVGGYRLNTDYNEVKTNMGRMFGFAYGHKENGAMFSHMAVMYANALYKRGYAHAGYKVLQNIFERCIQINESKIFPGIPEYFDVKGRGVYHYLTGSASWFILTEVTEVFGIKGDFGSLVLEPKLVKEQFGPNGIAGIETMIQDHVVTIEYVNHNNLDFGEYNIQEVVINDEQQDFIKTAYGVRIDKVPQTTKITVILG